MTGLSEPAAETMASMTRTAASVIGPLAPITEIVALVTVAGAMSPLTVLPTPVTGMVSLVTRLLELVRTMALVIGPLAPVTRVAALIA